MILPRLIPVLLVQDKGLVKTIKFKDPKYVGDPLNTVKIFNEYECDELMVIDIDASRRGCEPDYEMIKSLAIESRMPLCYGGGIKTYEQAERILSLGVEKIAISSLIYERPEIIKELSNAIGQQSIVAVLDVKKRLYNSKYHCYIYNGTKNTKKCPVEFGVELEKKGVGEFVLNSIDRDGTMNGYDLDLISKFREKVSTPITVLGGAGSFKDVKSLVNRFPIIGAGAGSMFVFKGKYRAVLVSYPTMNEREEILSEIDLERSHKGSV